MFILRRCLCHRGHDQLSTTRTYPKNMLAVRMRLCVLLAAAPVALPAGAIASGSLNFALAATRTGTTEAPTESVAQGLGGCGSTQWTCFSGSCIAQAYRCDGVPHCSDRSDELSCPQKWVGTTRVCLIINCQPRMPVYEHCKGTNISGVLILALLALMYMR